MIDAAVNSSEVYGRIRALGAASLRRCDSFPSEGAAIAEIATEQLIAQPDANRLGHAHRYGRLNAYRRLVRGAMLWAQSGFPLVIAGEKLIASLAATRMPKECAAELTMPWDTWAIRVPGELLWMRDVAAYDGSAAADVNITDIFVIDNWESEGRATAGKTVLVTNTHSPFSGAHIHVNDWCELADPENAVSESAGADEAIVMASRIVLGCVAELHNAGVDAPSVRAMRSGKTNKRGAPKSWTFQLRRQVVVDCREWVRSASASRLKIKPPVVQILVRGHWKPRLSEKVGRRVVVEPYWRGPEDAPIGVRPHKIKRNKGEE